MASKAKTETKLRRTQRGNACRADADGGARRRCLPGPRGSLVSCSTAERPALLQPALKCKGSNDDGGDDDEKDNEQR